MSDGQFIFCEGCGARLTPQDRSCPKCGHPAPGILSAESAASDLAAGKTANFPRLSQDMIETMVPSPMAGDPFASVPDPDATGVLDGSALFEAGRRSDGSGENGSVGIPRGKSAPSSLKAGAQTPQMVETPRKRRRIVFAALALVLVAGGAWFVAADPMGVMPGVYERFDKAASEAFPSRQTPENSEGAAVDGEEADETSNQKDSMKEQALGNDDAYKRLSDIYERICGFQEDLGPVVDGYNSYYIADDRSLREEGSQLAYDLRDTIQATKDELSGLKLIEGSPYVEDIDNLQNLATWMYNRVDVLCRSWDISLGLPGDERPVDHQDEILKPLRDVEKVNGKAVDVVEYEKNVYNWEPEQK